MTDPERTQRRLKAQTGVARVLLSSDTVRGGVEALLRVVCGSYDWPVGEYWAPRNGDDDLTLFAQYTDEDPELKPFLEATGSLSDEAGSGLAGEFLDREEPVIVPDLTGAPAFLRSDAAARAGLRSGFAVPVPLSDASGVLLFLTREEADDGEEAIEGLAALGAQLGQFIRRRRAEAGLRESEERFRTFARTVPDPVFLLDGDGRILYANARVESVFGYDPRQLRGESFLRLLPEGQQERHRALFERDPAEGDRVAWASYESEMLQRDGSEMPTEVTYGTFQQNGERFYTAAVRDITDRLLSEDRLRFQARLLDAVGEAVVATQLDGTVLYWNTAAEELYGWSATEVLGRTVAEIAPSDVSRAQAEEIIQRLQQGKSWSGEFMARDREGREFPVMVTDSPFLDESGEIVGIIGTSSEITERRRAEAGQRFLAEAGRVLASSLDYETTVKTVARLTVPILAEGCVVQVVDETLGRGPVTVATAAEEEGGPILASLEDWIAGPGEEGIAEVLDRCEAIAAPASDGPVRFDDPTLQAIGIESVLCVPLRARGNALGLLTMAARKVYDDRDLRLAGELGRRAALAMDNARLYRDAQTANRAKADFLAVVSHELRTPLNAIGGYADLLESGATGQLNEKQAKFVDRIKVGAGHLAQLIDEILTYARTEAQREQLLFRATRASRVAREAITTIEPQAREQSLELELDLPTEEVEIVTDSDKVRQVLINLLANAVKYTNEGSVSLTVEGGADGVVFRVTDTGIGIDPDDLNRVFEPFWQAESPRTRKVGGTGLGLSVSRRLVGLLGGTLDVESEPGVGSTFTVRLPAEPPPEPERRPTAEALTGS